MRGADNVFDDAHIFRLTDDTGMFQHTIYSVPDLSKGYTTDDNARALIMAVKLYEQNQQIKYFKLIERYLAFILYAQNSAGHFRNFMTYERQFSETEGSEECFGRCLWALAYTLGSIATPQGIKNACRGALLRAMPVVTTLQSIRGKAYAVVGLAMLDEPLYDDMIAKLADHLATCFENCAADANWQWFEANITYDNALLPWAMFVAFEQIGKVRLLNIAQKSLNFLDKNAFRDGYFRPVGCNGWWLQGGSAALYDQQPVEASMSTLAHLVAFQVTGETAMLTLAKQSFAWYSGANSCNKTMLDADTGGCYDGIEALGINGNQGAENIVGYFIAKLTLAQVVAAKK